MGQSEILNILENNRIKWFTLKEINNILGSSLQSTSQRMNKLRKREAVDMKVINKRFYYNFCELKTALNLRKEIQRYVNFPNKISDIMLINCVNDLVYVQKLKLLNKETKGDII